MGCSTLATWCLKRLHNEWGFLQRQCITAWEQSGGSCFIHYTTFVDPNYKIRFFLEKQSRAPRYFLEPIPLSAICNIASIWLSSHSLRCEIGCWGNGKELNWLCTLCPQQVWESEYHTLLECSAFDHIRACFPHIFSHELSLHTFLSQPQCGLSIATLISTILEHREALISSTHTMWYVSFGPIGHIWPSWTIMESIYLSLRYEAQEALGQPSTLCSHCHS